MSVRVIFNDPHAVIASAANPSVADFLGVLPKTILDEAALVDEQAAQKIRAFLADAQLDAQVIVENGDGTARAFSISPLVAGAGGGLIGFAAGVLVGAATSKKTS